jgi:hypothetical protein
VDGITGSADRDGRQGKGRIGHTWGFAGWRRGFLAKVTLCGVGLFVCVVLLVLREVSQRREKTNKWDGGI